MTITANLADGRVLNFPDGTDPAVIQATVKKMMAQEQPSEQTPAPAPAPEQSFGQQFMGGLKQTPANILGSAENIASLTTGAIAEPIAGVAGIVQAVNPWADEGAGARAVEGFRDALTYDPQTEAGQQQQAAMGRVIGAAGQTVTENVLEPLGVDNLADKTAEKYGPLAGTVVASLPTALMEVIPGGLALKQAKKIATSDKAARQLIADQIRSGNPNIDLVTQMLDESGNLVKNKNAIKAVDMLGGDIKAKQTVSVIENMNTASKVQVGKMLDIVEKMRREPIAELGQMTRPSDILGNSIANRVRDLVKINKKAGATIGEAAKQMKGQAVNITDARNTFFRDMQELGVNFEQIDGRIKLDFSDSTFVGGGAKQIETIANAIKTGEMDGLSAHRQKQFIRELVSFGEGKESAISKRSQAILKKLSSGIDEVLDGTSPEYRKANDRYANTIGLVEKFDKLAGKDIDIFSDMSDKSLGDKSQRLASRAESRVSIEQAIMELDKTLADFGVRYKDDIPSLSHTVTHLEDIFKLEPANSFQGRIERGAANVAQGQSLTGATATSAIDILKDIKQPDFDKKMRSLRLLTQTRK
jgi:hypothetical protein